MLGPAKNKISLLFLALHYLVIRKIQQEISSQVSEETKLSLSYSVMIVVSWVLYGVFVYYLPFPYEIKGWQKILIGIVAGIIGAATFYSMHSLVRFTLKTIVEFVAALLFFFNCCYSILVAAFCDRIAMILVYSAEMKHDDAVAAVFITAALLLAIVDVFSFFVLYPLSQTVGTELE